MKLHNPAVRSAILESGIRNVTLNTIAPTGSVGGLAETTTGIEPYFAFKWTSTTRIGTAQERMSVLERIVDKFGEASEQWPDYVVTVQNGITPTGHVKVMATAQRWIDSSISKTVNLPAEATLDDVSSAYISMWRQGCKGGTVYVDESRDEQVLHADEEEKAVDVISVVDHRPMEGALRPSLEHGIGPTFSIETPFSSIHVTFRCDSLTGEPYDFFVNAGKGEVAANAQGLARLVSMVLRWPDGEFIPQKARLEMIREQLAKIPGQSQRGVGPDAVVSLPDATKAPTRCRRCPSVSTRSRRCWRSCEDMVCLVKC
jgi:ribonucleoside-diphosphate reductase alpha chain